MSGIKSCIEKINITNLENMKKIILKLSLILFKLPLNKQLKFLSVTIVIISVFEEDGKYYPQAFLDDCLHEL